MLLARLPPLRWLPHYRWRAWLLGDAVAGVTVGVVHVPQGERPQLQKVWVPSYVGRASREELWGAVKCWVSVPAGWEDQRGRI